MSQLFSDEQVKTILSAFTTDRESERRAKREERAAIDAANKRHEEAEAARLEKIVAMFREGLDKAFAARDAAPPEEGGTVASLDTALFVAGQLDDLVALTPLDGSGWLSVRARTELHDMAVQVRAIVAKAKAPS